MDRSFLSQPEVVQASRKFVCIRLATYESLTEAEVLRHIFIGGSGQVENTTFAILSPDGRTPLVRSGRGPNWAYRQSQDMAAGMEAIANYYHSRPAQAGDLPAVPNLRLAVNVGACDNLPVVAALSDDPRQLEGWRRRLTGVCWDPALLGRAIYTLDATRNAAGLVPGSQSGLVVIQSGQFGQDGHVLARLDPDSPNLVRELDAALSRYRAQPKNVHEHMRQGHMRGVYWRTQIPVTDPHR